MSGFKSFTALCADLAAAEREHRANPSADTLNTARKAALAVQTCAPDICGEDMGPTSDDLHFSRLCDRQATALAGWRARPTARTTQVLRDAQTAMREWLVAERRGRC